MLPRTLESEAMDSTEEARDYDTLDHGTVNRIFVTDFLAVWNHRNPILDAGTGTAQIPIELCKQSPTAHVTAIDLAEHMLRVARDNVGRAGLADRIRLQCCDAKALPFPDGTFATVISNSIVHHIPDPASVLGEMVRVLMPGGILFIRDLLRPLDENDVQRLVTTYASAANAHQRQMFAASLRAALTLTEIRTLVEEFGFDPATVRQTSDRHWTWTIS